MTDLQRNCRCFAGFYHSSHFASTVSFFTCSDPGIAPVPTGIPKTFVKLGNSSFKVIQENLTWSEANRRCEAEGAHLASIRDLITQAYLELQVYRAKQPMWIGLSSVQVMHPSEKGKVMALQLIGIFSHPYVFLCSVEHKVRCLGECTGCSLPYRESQ